MDECSEDLGLFELANQSYDTLGNFSNYPFGGFDDANHTFYPRHDPVFESVKFYLAHIVSPTLCLVGITGNILNVLVLTRRRIQSSIDGSMERAAYMGLIALAVSDFLFCLCTLPDGFLAHQSSIVYREKGFRLYYNLYKMYLQNVFSHMSTWLTVLIAVSRYAAICHPLHAKIFVHAKGTRLAICLVFLMWPCLDLPAMWDRTYIKVGCGENASYVIDLGVFSLNKTLNMTFRHLWFNLGYLIPVCVLVFCNTQLTRALRERYSAMRLDCRVHGRTRQHNSRITPTLICMIVMFVVLVSPSEIIQFTYYFTHRQNAEILMFLISISNILHTLNFTINFVLYCILNSHFRKTLKDVFCTRRGRKPNRHNALCTVTYSNGTSKIYTGPASSVTAV